MQKPLSILLALCALFVAAGLAYAVPPAPPVDTLRKPQLVVGTTSGSLQLYAYSTTQSQLVLIEDNTFAGPKYFADIDVEDMDGDGQLEYLTLQYAGTNTSATTEFRIRHWNQATDTWSLFVTGFAAGSAMPPGKLVSCSIGRTRKNTVVFHTRGTTEDLFSVYTLTAGALALEGTANHDLSGTYNVNDIEDASMGQMTTAGGGTLADDTLIFTRPAGPWIGAWTVKSPDAVIQGVFAGGYGGVAIDALLPESPPASAGGGDLFAQLKSNMHAAVQHANGGGLQVTVYPDTDLTTIAGDVGIDLAGAGINTGETDDLGVLYQTEGVKAVRAADLTAGSPNTIAWQGTAVLAKPEAVAIAGVRGTPPAVTPPAVPANITTNAGSPASMAVVSSTGNISLLGFDSASDVIYQMATLNTNKTFVDVAAEDVDNDGKVDFVTIQQNAAAHNEATVWGWNGSAIFDKGTTELPNLVTTGTLVAVGAGTFEKNTIVVLYHRSGGLEDAIRTYQFTGGAFIAHPNASAEYPISGGQYAGAQYNDLSAGDIKSTGWPTVTSDTDDVAIVRSGPSWIASRQLVPPVYHTPVYAANFPNAIAVDNLIPASPPASGSGGDFMAKLSSLLDIGIYAAVEAQVYPTGSTPTNFNVPGNFFAGLDLTGVNLGGAGDELVALYSASQPSAYRALQAISVTAPNTLTARGNPVRIDDNAVAIDGARTGRLTVPVELSSFGFE